MKKEIIPCFNGVEIRKDKQGRVSLTDLWKAAGSPNKKDPSTWQTREATTEFIEAAKNLITPKMGELKLVTSSTGRYGGTFAHKQIALAYAKYLSPELHLTVNQVFFERLEEEKNPELAVTRAIDTWKKKGKNESWIEKRMKGISTRKIFTGALKKAGCDQKGYRLATNAMYTPQYGGDASLVRKKLNAPEKANAREHMSEIQLTTIQLTEMIAAQNIEKKRLYGNDACVHECNITSRLIAGSVFKALKAA